MLIIGLTGGIASGKSTVSSYLSRTHHLPIIDADLLARTVIDPGTSGYTLVISHFGPDRILQPDGITLDRAALGEIVFNDPDERRWLNGVIHPRVRREIVKGVVRCWMTGEWACVVDVPLLIEAGLWKWVGEIVVVFVNDKLQISRLLARPSNPPLTPAQAQSRISSQMPLSSKIPYSTAILDNSGTPPDLHMQIDRLVSRWKDGQGGKSGWWWRVCWVLPFVGLVAGGICVGGRWLRGGQGKGRRRGRGEAGGGDAQGERIELSDLGKGRRRGTGSSIMSDD